MRVTAMLAGAALVLAACGGEKAAETADSTAMAPAAEPAAAPAATGTTHEVQMVMEGTAYKYVPAELTIKAGDTVVFKSVSGGLHNVQFYPDSIPPSAAAVLDAAITNKQGPLASALVNEGESITISFAGAPAGEYKYFCLPHQALGMVAKITVTE
ncbi:MAG TPA: plastocyanin/azurin family copper-binding protein [Gemmatimonadales bacterium]|nr:plastocyanin/azurin family copper-binding protein [Gemmatimonadales bacterium]